MRPFEPRLEERDALSDWDASARSHDPSLPLAAVPSLTLAPPFRPPASPSAAPPPTAPEALFSPTTQYIAWRRPPCRLAFDIPLPRGIHCGRGASAERSGPELVLSAGHARSASRDWMMRPATSGWLLHREDVPLPLGA
ncbi:MAG TPA: hypothetical protein VML94_07735 [Thermoplasmata archaeon]|nr:hypothetical protein [Thermoplasmata archaeon]